MYRVMHPHPNSYTYSKRLAEALVESYFPDLPVCIVRPSIGNHFLNYYIYFVLFIKLLVIMNYFYYLWSSRLKVRYSAQFMDHKP